MSTLVLRRSHEAHGKGWSTNRAGGEDTSKVFIERGEIGEDIVLAVAVHNFL